MLAVRGREEYQPFRALPTAIQLIFGGAKRVAIFRRDFAKNGAAGMQAYDILMLIVLALAIVWGAWKGLAWQIASIASIGLSYFVALHFRLPLARVINASPPWNIF